MNLTRSGSRVAVKTSTSSLPGTRGGKKMPWEHVILLRLVILIRKVAGTRRHMCSFDLTANGTCVALDWDQRPCREMRSVASKTFYRGGGRRLGFGLHSGVY